MTLTKNASVGQPTSLTIQGFRVTSSEAQILRLVPFIPYHLLTNVSHGLSPTTVRNTFIASWGSCTVIPVSVRPTAESRISSSRLIKVVTGRLLKE